MKKKELPRLPIQGNEIAERGNTFPYFVVLFSQPDRKCVCLYLLISQFIEKPYSLLFIYMADVFLTLP